jgi:ABC-2 type transport system permease protein
VSSPLAHELRILPHVVAYELRKATAFRVGFLLRELLRGVGRVAVMGCVYFAMFESSGAEHFRGYRFPDLIGYLVWTLALQRCLTDDRTLDLAEQIFDGYVTKYLVMPVSFFTLLWGRFVQFTSVQLAASVLCWLVGALLLPSLWPDAPSPLALLQALTLLLLGAACYLLAHFILNCLAFWLDVVWSLLSMFRFISMFVAGALVPVSLMPPAADAAFRWLFPYWTVFAPAEILLGRMGTAEFARGVLVLSVSVVLLHWLALVVFHRGLARYSGVGT